MNKDASNCEKLVSQRLGDVLHVKITRPERRNAVDGETALQLYHTFKDFDADQSLKVAILSGAEGNFCAGADLQAIAAAEHLNPIYPDGDLGPMGPTRLQLSKPVIAAVEGYAVAGGIELAAWCDLRVAAETATFGVFCRRFGVPLIDGGTVRLTRLIGQSRAMDLILTGRPVSANEAFSIGLVNRLCANGDALNEAIRLAREIASKPQTCLRNDRKSLLEQWQLPEHEALLNEMQHGLRTLNSGETRNGALAFSQGKGRHGKE